MQFGRYRPLLCLFWRLFGRLDRPKRLKRNLINREGVVGWEFHVFILLVSVIWIIRAFQSVYLAWVLFIMSHPPVFLVFMFHVAFSFLFSFPFSL
jgi:hypothetical protein